MTAEFGATYDTAPIDGFVTLLSTHPGRPAYRAGFRKNDVIIQVDDTPITSNEALRRAIRSKPPGMSMPHPTNRIPHLLCGGPIIPLPISLRMNFCCCDRF